MHKRAHKRLQRAHTRFVVRAQVLLRACTFKPRVHACVHGSLPNLFGNLLLSYDLKYQTRLISIVSKPIKL